MIVHINNLVSRKANRMAFNLTTIMSKICLSVPSRTGQTKHKLLGGQQRQRRCHRMFDYGAYEQCAIKALEIAISAHFNILYIIS